MADDYDSSLWYGYDVDAANRTASDSYVNATTRTPSTELDKDAFLKLLLTQLQYQDPLDPVDNTEFIAQMAQLTVAEQMQNMAQSFSHSQAYNLIGKYIYANYYDETSGLYTEVSGEVTSVLISGGEAYVMVGDKQVPVDKVQMVYSDYLAQGVNSLAANTVTSQALALMGKYVQAVTVDSDGNLTGYVEGKVEDLKFDSSGNPLLVVGNDEVYVKEVISVSENMRLLGKTISANTASGALNGTVTGVEFEDDNTYLLIDGKRVSIKSIALVSDALKYVGQDVSYLGVAGTVTGVMIRSGVPYLVVGGTEEIPAVVDDNGDEISATVPASPGVEINFADFKGVTLDS